MRVMYHVNLLIYLQEKETMDEVQCLRIVFYMTIRLFRIAGSEVLVVNRYSQKERNVTVNISIEIY